MTTMGTLPAFDPPEIFPTTGNFFACKRPYLSCSECSRVPPTASKYMEPGYGWASRIVCMNQECPKRGKPYLICRICVSSGLYLVNKQRKHRTTPAHLRQHSKLATHIRAYDSWAASHARQEVEQPVATVDQAAADQMPTETDCSIQDGPVSVQSKKRPFGVIDSSTMDSSKQSGKASE